MFRGCRVPAQFYWPGPGPAQLRFDEVIARALPPTEQRAQLRAFHVAAEAQAPTHWNIAQCDHDLLLVCAKRDAGQAAAVVARLQQAEAEREFELEDERESRE